MKNKIKHFRMRKGLSQRQLAELTGTSQQQIQRIEVGRIATRLELATNLSAALGQPLNKLFPESEKAVKAAVDQTRVGFIPSDQTFDQLAECGVELDIREWYFKFLLRGHKKPFIHRVSGSEKRYLFSAVQDERGPGLAHSFLVYETSNERIAISSSELVFCHFLYEPSGTNEQLSEEISEVNVFLCGNEERLGFQVEPDNRSEPDDQEMGEFDGIFFDLTSGIESSDRIHFVDEDGEDVFIRAGDLAMLQVPLWVVEPEDTDENGDDD